MTLLRVLLAIFFPPLAVYDRGCGCNIFGFWDTNEIEEG